MSRSGLKRTPRKKRSEWVAEAVEAVLRVTYSDACDGSTIVRHYGSVDEAMRGLAERRCYKPTGRHSAG